HLLWRHVGHRSDGSSRTGEVLRAHSPHRIRGEGGPRGHRFPLRCQLGQSEIQYFRVPSFGYEDVGWFGVAVDGALRMCRVRASAISMASDRINSVSIGRPAMRCLSVSPSRNSMAMNGRPFSSAISWMVHMFG